MTLAGTNGVQVAQLQFGHDIQGLVRVNRNPAGCIKILKRTANVDLDESEFYSAFKSRAALIFF